MLGIDVAELRGHFLADLVASSDVATVRTMWERLSRTGQLRSTVRLRHRDGHFGWLDVSGQRLDNYDQYAGPVYLVVAQEHLAASEQRWRLAFGHSPLGAALVTAAGDIALANASLGEMLDNRPEALAVMSLADSPTPTIPAVMPRSFRRCCPASRRPTRSRSVSSATTASVLWGEMAAAEVHDMHGDVNEVVVQIKGITQRREANWSSPTGRCTIR